MTRDNNHYKLTDQRVWPFPNQISKGSGKLIITKKLTSTIFSGPGKNLLDPKVISEFNEFVFDSSPSGTGALNYSISIASEDTLTKDDIDESYSLSITLDGKISITAMTYVGAVHGLMTLSQLIRKEGNQYVINNAPLTITKDKPGVSYRAVMLDVARQYLPVSVILKQIRAMALQKLNVLHLHLIDGQSFPLQLDSVDGGDADNDGKSFTSTIAKGGGAFSAEEVYTNADISTIIQYAKAYGIKVIPEIDTPGHTYSWVKGYPNIMACTKDINQTDLCCPEPPCGFLDLKEKFSEVTRVVKGVLKEVISAFELESGTGYGSYIHLGFDEVGCNNKDADGNCKSPSCGNAYGVNSVKYLNWLLAYMKDSHSTLTSIIWIDQILESNFPDTQITLDSSKVILHFWTLPPDAAGHIKSLAEDGYRIINSQSSTYYLDAGGQGNSGIAGGPVMSKAGEKYNLMYFKYWISNYSGVTGGAFSDTNVVLNHGWQTSIEDIYLNNITYLPTALGGPRSANGSIPYAEIPLFPSEKKGGIIGGAVALWAELIDQCNIDQKLWPKAASFAESMWKFDPNRLPDNMLNAKFRLAYAREDLLRIGIQASPIGPGDTFQDAPWGSRNSENTDLMHDVNDTANQQVPEGYIYRYKSAAWGYPAAYCKGATTQPINPFCGPKLSPYMTCDQSIKADYIQQGCPVDND